MNATKPCHTAGEPAIRSSLYRLLSTAFRHPTPERFGALAGGDFVGGVLERLSAVPHLRGIAGARRASCEAAVKALAGTGYQAFESAFIQTFDVGAPAPPCPPYEGLYRDGERTSLMLEISEFYGHFGLRMCDEEGSRELADHIAAELEFVHFLTFKESQSGDDGNSDLMKGYVRAQKDFMERHLACWAPGFSERLRNSGRLPLLAELAAILADVVSAELAYAAEVLAE